MARIPISKPFKDGHIHVGRSSSITLAVLFTFLLAISILTLLYFMQLASNTNQRNEIASIIEMDVEGLLDTHRVGGIEALVDILQYRLKNPKTGHIYALANRFDTVLVGNFAFLPDALPHEMEVFEVNLTEEAGKESGLPEGREYAILATYKTLPDGYTLMVGRNMPDVEVKQHFIDRLGWAVIGLLVALAAAGFFIGERVVYRINLIADTSLTIMRTGDLSKRIPVPGKWDDLSKLAVVLNQLFDNVEILMDQIRQVSDNIAHDLRTPLTRLKNQLEMLHDRGEDEQLGISECTEKLIGEADHILDTFSALLRIRNIESGKWRGEGEELALDALVTDVVEFYEPLAQDKEQTISTDLESIMFFGDKHLLFQAVANVVDNAIKYAPYEGHISIRLYHVGTTFIGLRITNSGSMVEDKQLNKIFHRFYRTDAARCTRSGNGLGLSLVKAIVELHQGMISAENTDEGFTISMMLPFKGHDSKK